MVLSNLGRMTSYSVRYFMAELYGWILLSIFVFSELVFSFCGACFFPCQVSAYNNTLLLDFLCLQMWMYFLAMLNLPEVVSFGCVLFASHFLQMVQEAF
jgi:hypothetical protein